MNKIHCASEERKLDLSQDIGGQMQIALISLSAILHLHVWVLNKTITILRENASLGILGYCVHSVNRIMLGIKTFNVQHALKNGKIF